MYGKNPHLVDMEVSSRNWCVCRDEMTQMGSFSTTGYLNSHVTTRSVCDLCGRSRATAVSSRDAEFTQFVRKSARSLTPAMNPFRAPSRLDGAWHKVGLASAFPDLDNDYDGRRITAKCKAFRIPNSNTKGSQEAGCPVEADIDLPGDLKDQVLMFKYKGKLHAIDHVSETETHTQDQADCSSNARTRRSHCHRGASSTLKTLVSCSALVSHVPSTAGPLISSLDSRTVATTSSRFGRCSCGTLPHPMELLGIPIRRCG
jgi:hypothetical protein